MRDISDQVNAKYPQQILSKEEDMRLKMKVTLGSILLAVIPLLIASLVNTKTATDRSQEALELAASNRLVAIRDLTKGRIEDYFHGIRNQVIALSNNKMVIEAMGAFTESFGSYNKDIPGAASTDNRAALEGYYKGDFSREYKRLNQGEQPENSAWLAKLNADSIALQHRFISANPHPLGEKHKLTDLGDSSRYSVDHANYHPVLRDFLEKFQYYDIFLVDTHSGNIVYSVYKELDFATSLKDGPFANTGIGEAFRRANEAQSPEFATLVDFSPYPPSYQAAASFIASPIYSGNQKIGVLIFQMPIGRINAIMTHDNNWSQVGLGESGETYLVGADTLMRSTSRFLVEDKPGYLEAIKEAGVSASIAHKIDAKETSIGLHPIDSQGSNAALGGKTGFDIFPDYRNVPVLSAYAPVNIKGVNWAILAEMDEEEAFRSATALASELLTKAVVAALLLALLATGVGFWIAGMFSKPVVKLSGTIHSVEQNADLTQTVDIDSKDEIGDAANAFNSMMLTFRNSMHKVSDATAQLATTAEETSVITEQATQAVHQQLDETTQLTTAMTEMSATVQEVAANVTQTSHATNEVNEQTTSGMRAMQETISQIERLASEVQSTASTIQQLEQHSEEIGSVLDVIKGIAEQTNLLALNAAIEAARAGEQGRGFAVVADEVRNLANKTQASTEEINQMIVELQSGSRDAVTAMNKSQEMASSAVDQAAKTGDALTTISNSIGEINDMSTQIASAAEEQSVVVDEINKNVVQINNVAEQTSAGAKQTSVASSDLSRLASELSGLVAQFKVQ